MSEATPPRGSNRVTLPKSSRAGREGYSLIIVGKHGHNWIKDKIIGSTAAKICEIARRPVLMVPLQEE